MNLLANLTVSIYDVSFTPVLILAARFNVLESILFNVLFNVLESAKPC